MNFRDAANAAPAAVGQTYRPGKGALESKHRKQVDSGSPRRLTGSIALDAALARQPPYSHQPRWDYGIGYEPPQGSECAIWIEVHPAATSNVKEVVDKLNWLRSWLRNEASDLGLMTGAAPNVPSYVWIATSGVHIPRNSPQARKLNEYGLRMPVERLRLP